MNPRPPWAAFSCSAFRAPLYCSNRRATSAPDCASENISDGVGTTCPMISSLAGGGPRLGGELQVALARGRVGHLVGEPLVLGGLREVKLASGRLAGVLDRAGQDGTTRRRRRHRLRQLLLERSHGLCDGRLHQLGEVRLDLLRLGGLF